VVAVVAKATPFVLVQVMTSVEVVQSPDMFPPPNDPDELYWMFPLEPPGDVDPPDPQAAPVLESTPLVSLTQYGPPVMAVSVKLLNLPAAGVVPPIAAGEAR
jgi:hypothetical protein